MNIILGATLQQLPVDGWLLVPWIGLSIDARNSFGVISNVSSQLFHKTLETMKYGGIR
jgi:hypothetical protein